MMDENLYDTLITQGFTEDQIQYLMELGVLAGEEGILQDQMAQAQALRQGEGPQGIYAGRLYVAANPLQHLGHAMEQYGAERDIRDTREALRTNLDEQMMRRVAFLRAMGGPSQVSPVASPWMPPEARLGAAVATPYTFPNDPMGIPLDPLTRPPNRGMAY